MTSVVVALLLGVVSSAVVWLLVQGIFTHPTLARRNVRGIDVPTAGGLVMVLALLPGWAAMNLLVAETELDVVSVHLAGVYWVTGVVAVFALLGALDDLLAQGHERGFRGHVGAILQGRLTTGGVKLVGGGLVALAIAAGSGPLWEVAVNAAVIALAANLANLFDRAPARLTKVSVVAFVALLLAASAGERHGLASIALVLGTAVGLVVPELRERVMLGDTGANPLGAMLGLGVVATTGIVVTAVVLVGLVALNLLSEKVSFSTVIDRTPALRWLDQLGRDRP
jgi:UDP-GlcNAc:undecaprenyl-phosphate GlcNAc-1-phosphate transferase